MLPSTTYLFIFIYIIINCSSVENRRHFDRRFPISHEIEKNKTVNICVQRELKGNLFCECDKGSETIKSASIAECYIYSKDMRYDDPVWKHFASQSTITELKMQVRPDGLLRFMPTPGLKHLPILKKFALQFGTIHELKPFIFVNRTELRKLYLDRNQIIHITPGAFAYLPSLIRLHIDRNRIMELKADSFTGAPQLRILNLSRNNISVVHHGAFAGIEMLEELDLSFNEISVLTNDTLQGVSSLNYLNLEFNRLNYIPSDSLCLVPKLDKLILLNNEIQEIEPDAFNCVRFLGYLDLAGNNLKFIQPDTFRLLGGLHYLDLQNNLLSTLTYDTIAPVLKNLNIFTSFFSLDYNPLECTCRLLWTFDLLKETNSSLIIKHLNSLRCKVMVDLVTDHEENFSLEESSLSGDNFTDYYDKHDDFWKEEMKTAHYFDLMNISPSLLICPQEEPIKPSFQVPLDANKVQPNSASILGLKIMTCVYFNILMLLFV